MNENTIYRNLSKLVEIELLEKTEPKGNKREKYYSVPDQNLAKKAIEKYRRGLVFVLLDLYLMKDCISHSLSTANVSLKHVSSMGFRQLKEYPLF